MAKGLTKRQAAILEFIIDSIREQGHPPTIAEIGEKFGISSTNGVNDHLIALGKKGYIERSSKARGIYVTPKAAAGLYQSDAVMIPLVGQVAAGLPVLAEENIEEYIAVGGSVASPDAFCLRVRGDSMIEDGMLDGDIIVVDQRKRAKAGDVVVALIEDETTVKRFFPHGAMVELRPANAAMKPISVPSRDVSIQGVVVALQRTL